MKLLLTIVLSLTFLSSFAAVWRVNNNPNYIVDCDHCFSELSEAVASNLVAPTDTIHVEASPVVYAAVTLNKELTIIGAGYYLVENPGYQAYSEESKIVDMTITAGGSGSRIHGLKIDGPSNNNIIFSGTQAINDVVISRCHVTSGIIIGNTTPMNNVSFTKNILGAFDISSSSGPSITGLVISNNYIVGALQLFSNHSAIVSHNVIGGGVNIHASANFFNNICTSTSASMLTQNNNGAGNIFNNVFVSNQPGWFSGGANSFAVPESTIFPSGGSLTPEQELDPLEFCAVCYTGYVAGGPNDAEVGMYGGLDPYQVGGIPGIPSIFARFATPQAYPDGEVILEVGARSNN